jgi:hypothetical protein
MTADKIYPTTPLPTTPAIELPNVSSDRLFITPPATLPPTAPEIS